MGSSERSENCDYDVVLVGGGPTGINTAYYIQKEFPDLKYTILENRGAIGGTWDIFRYPGIRSDSDLYTLGFSWRPWASSISLATGESILTYVKESAEEYGIDKKIQFHHHPLQTNIPGIENFKGKTIYPQFWPKDLDYEDKKVVIIGSGASAITLVPNLAEKAGKVTMLQRSPTYVISVPAEDPMGSFIFKYLPSRVASQLIRWKAMLVVSLFHFFCINFPNAARNFIQERTKKELPSSIPIDPAFNPNYNPWEQRLGVCPDNDFFKCLHTGKVEIVTDNIKTITSSGIDLGSGNTLDPDIIVQATGLKMQLLGGAKINIDGESYNLATKCMWKGALLQDLPNSIIVIGNSNGSYTLGTDTTAIIMVRLLKQMRENNFSSLVPRIDDNKMKTSNFLALRATYVKLAKGNLPLVGDRGPWKRRKSYLVDYWLARYGDLTQDLEFTGGRFDKNQ